MLDKNNKKRLKRLPKSQRTHVRRLKQATRNDPVAIAAKV
jgi:hypothetical protein